MNDISESSAPRVGSSALVRLVVPLLLLVIIIEVVWFSCITLFGGGNDGPGKADIRPETGLPSPSQPNAGGQP